MGGGRRRSRPGIQNQKTSQCYLHFGKALASRSAPVPICPIPLLGRIEECLAGIHGIPSTFQWLRMVRATFGTSLRGHRANDSKCVKASVYDTDYFILLWKIPHKWPKKARYHDAVHDTCYFILVRKIPHKWPKKARYHDAVYDTCYSFYYGKSHINGPKKIGTMML